MTELTRLALNEYFSELKNYHLIILMIFSVIIALIQVLSAAWVSRKIERFKGQLKKSEIKFSKYNELQVIALREIYHLLVTLHSSNNAIFRSKSKNIDHIAYKKLINNWIISYKTCVSKFAYEKILLTKELKLLFSRTLKDFEEINHILLSEAGNLDHHEMEFQGDWQLMYDYEDNELEIISSKIEKIKEKQSIINSEKHIRELRDRIEIVFQEMN